jgi:hypothetical protein
MTVVRQVTAEEAIAAGEEMDGAAPVEGDALVEMLLRTGKSPKGAANVVMMALATVLVDHPPAVPLDDMIGRVIPAALPELMGTIRRERAERAADKAEAEEAQEAPAEPRMEPAGEMDSMLSDEDVGPVTVMAACLAAACVCQRHRDGELLGDILGIGADAFARDLSERGRATLSAISAEIGRGAAEARERGGAFVVSPGRSAEEARARRKAKMAGRARRARHDA